MKRRVIAFVLMLSLVTGIKLGLPAIAAMIADTGNAYSVTLGHVAGWEAPVSAIVTNDIGPPENAQPTHKEFAFTTEYDAGKVMRTVVTITAMDQAPTDGEWRIMNDWLEDAVAQAIPVAQNLDAGGLSEAILNTIDETKRDATKDAEGKEKLWSSDMRLSRLTVDAPYYPELRRGDRDEDVAKLQQKLIELGYLDDKADGQFGGRTETAIKEVEAELRAREQAVIDDAMAKAEAAQLQDSLAAAQQAADDGTAADDDTAADETPVQEAPQPPVPATEVDGVADLGFQIRLHSQEFPLRDGALNKGANAAAVGRLQRRLIQLGYLAGTVDGDYGGNTRRGVRLFQHYNGLTLSGIADENTQVLIFGGNAKAPARPLMTRGNSGDAVTQLQARLIQLGFMRGAPDGDYGVVTVNAVRELQTYMREKEVAQLAAEAAARRAAQQAAAQAQSPEAEAPEVEAPEVEAPVDEAAQLPTIEVNGVADPLMLDALFANDFGEIKGALKSGDKNLDVLRLQRRLSTLEYLYGIQGGTYGDTTQSAVRDFQERHNLPKDGIAGPATARLLFSKEARKQLKPYVLKVDIAKQRVYAYGLDENEEHTVLVRTMKASTGLDATPTPKGTYQATTGPGARWHHFKKYKVWGQYAYYIEGDYLFHSILYNQKGGKPNGSQYNLGSKASHGCVRLAVEDAKWIWNNCPPYTQVIVR